MEKNFYEVRGYTSLFHYELGYEAKYVGEFTNKNKAHKTAIDYISCFFAVAVVDKDFNNTIYTKNKYLTKLLKGTLLKEELPLLVGISHELDLRISEQLKEA